MGYLADLFPYLFNVFSLHNFSALLIGVVVGLVIGAIPGLSPPMAIALMIPVSFYMPPETALIMMTSVYAAGIYGGSFSAILMRAPGTSASAATSIEGWELTIRGKAIEAIRVSTFASVVGGLLSAVALLLIAPPLAKVALLFQAPEYFLVAFLGLTSIASVSFKSLTKGLISGFIGILISTIGVDMHTAYPRYTFGWVYLEGKIDIVPAIIGLFGFAQALEISAGKAADTILLSGRKTALSWNLWPKFSEVRRLKGSLIRGWIIGLIVGIIPAAGGSIAQWIAYSEEIRRAKPGDQFGKGEMKGLAACEGSNNSTTGTSMIPMFVLGIPGGISAAVILGALMIFGLNPGMGLFHKSPHVVYTVMWGFLVANLVMGFVAVFVARSMAYVTYFPRGLLAPLIIIFCVIGVYAASGNIDDVYVLCAFGLMGYFLEKYDFSPAGVLLGLILGPICEDGFRSMIRLSEGHLFSYVFSRPISDLFLVLIALTIFFSVKNKKRFTGEDLKE
jgi:putative tricarboxylic transport membrane protein